jgi:hypothetical protein
MVAVQHAYSVGWERGTTTPLWKLTTASAFVTCQTCEQAFFHGIPFKRDHVNHESAGKYVVITHC